jgi:protein-tyrosine-phosphatase/predicted ATP-grasp superfamily ATP-dependent carboligase
MQTSSNLRPVLILGAAPRVAVPIARLLRLRCGVSVDVAAMMRSDQELRSRAIRSFVPLPDFLHEPEAFTKSLVSLIREKQFDMLIPVQDGAVAAIAQNYEILSSLLHVGCPPPQIVERVLNKDFTLKVAEQCDIRVPRTHHVSTAADVEMLGQNLVFPVVVKPGERKGVASFKVRYFTRREELLSFLASNRYGDLLLQEYCPGVGIGIEMLIHKGECMAAFQHRRLKEDPPSGGVAVMAIAEDADSELAEASYRLLRALQWDGVAMVEFRKNPADGKWALMEINGRYWGTTSLPLQAGVEFPVYEWRLAHGQDPRIPDTYKTGMRWRWSTGYLERLHSILVGFRGGLGPQTSRWKALAEIPGDFSPWIRDAVWSWSDPIPAVAETIDAAINLVKGDLRAAFRRLVPRRTRIYMEQYQRLGHKERPTYAKLRISNMTGADQFAKRKVSPQARSFVTVCFGNIMRSPMAEEMLKRELAKAGAEHYSVCSAGLHACEGRTAHPWALEVSQDLGMPLDQHHAKLLTAEMIEKADAVLAMDYENLAELLARFPHAKDKMFMLGAYAEGPQRCREIPDPYFGDVAGTRQCYSVLQTCVRNLVASLSQEPTAASTLQSGGVPHLRRTLGEQNAK